MFRYYSYPKYSIRRPDKKEKFSALAASTLYYTVPAPHFTSGDRGKNKIVNELGDILYESASNTVILGGPNFSDNECKVAFFERDLSTNDTIIIVSFVKTDKKLNVLKRIKWDDVVGGIEL